MLRGPARTHFGRICPKRLSLVLTFVHRLDIIKKLFRVAVFYSYFKEELHVVYHASKHKEFKSNPRYFVKSVILQTALRHSPHLTRAKRTIKCLEVKIQNSETLTSPVTS